MTKSFAPSQAEHSSASRTPAARGDRATPPIASVPNPITSVGNLQIQRVCKECAKNHPHIQPSDDPLEREADEVANRVMRKEATPPSVSSVPSSGPASTPHFSAETKSKVDAVIGSSGQPLDAATRNFVEPRFGRDFSHVRIHIGSAAADSARAVNARAYTAGHHIAFGQGQYAPGSEGGNRLLAHELTHVTQQCTSLPTIQRQALGCADLIANPSIASLVSGRAVHAAIAEHFASEAEGATEVMIPGASAAPLRTGGICGDDSPVIPPQILGGAAGGGFPDLARITAGGILQIAEIKPAILPCLAIGEEQLLRYIDQGNALDPAQVAWRASIGASVVAPILPSNYEPPSLSMGTAQVQTAWCSPGLLAYAVRRQGDPEPVPVPAPGTNPVPVPIPVPVPGPSPTPQPESEPIEEIKRFVKRVLDSGEDAVQAARDFVRQHPEVRDFLIGAAIGLVLAMVIQDILTAGIGILDNPAIIAIVTALFKVAQEVPEPI